MAIKYKPATNALRFSIDQPDGNAYTITVCARELSKKDAEQLLASKAEHQRAIKSWSRAKLTFDMDEGQWWFTGTPIILNNEGHLIDGQHRLESFIKSKSETCVFLIVEGVPREAYVGIDSGVTKNVGDYFKFNGVENAATAAAVARWLIRYDSTTATGETKHTSVIGKSETLNKYEIHADAIQESIKADRAFGFGSLLGSNGAAAALIFIIKREYGEQIMNDFIGSLCNGTGSNAVVKQLNKQLRVDNNKPRCTISPEQRFASVIQAAKNYRGFSIKKALRPTIEKLQSLRA